MKIWKSVVFSLALALTATVATPPPARAQMAVEAELTALMAKNQPYVEMMVETQAVFLETIDHIAAAMDKAEAPLSKAEAQAWSSAWETKARARLAAVKQRLATTPRLTAEDARKVFGEADTRGLSEVLASAPKSVEDTLQAAENTLNQTAALAPLAAAGDQAAANKLARQTFAITLYMVEIENQTLRTAIATLDPGHPQRSLAQSILFTNLAAMEIQRMILRGYNGEELEGPATARRVRGHLAEAEVAAKRMPREAKASIDSLAKDAPEEGKAFLEKLRPVFATYTQSSEVELKTIRVLQDAAAALDKEDFEAVSAALEKSQGLLDERIALQTGRTGALSR